MKFPSLQEIEDEQKARLKEMAEYAFGKPTGSFDIREWFGNSPSGKVANVIIGPLNLDLCYDYPDWFEYEQRWQGWDEPESRRQHESIPDLNPSARWQEQYPYLSLQGEKTQRSFQARKIQENCRLKKEYSRKQKKPHLVGGKLVNKRTFK